MNPSQRLEEDIRQLKEKVAAKERELKDLHRACFHQWGEVKYDPIVVEGYYDQGDPPGTMGVDRRLPGYVSGSTTRRWTKICSKCGQKVSTERTKRQRNGSGLEAEVPDFGDTR